MPFVAVYGRQYAATNWNTNIVVQSIELRMAMLHIPKVCRMVRQSNPFWDILE
jgi:hypothetical protein